MKRFLILLLALALLLPTVSCSQEINTPAPAETVTATAEEVKTTPKPQQEEVKPVINYPKISDPLTPEKLAEIPIANSSMTTDELRQICLDYFQLQLTFFWTPDAKYTYTIESSEKRVSLDTGFIYAGIPYVTVGTGNLYRWLESYDTETGIMDASNYLKQPKLFGNQCSVGAFWGWGRVVNSAKYTWTQSMVKKNGFIPVGPYTYDDDLDSFLSSSGTPTKEICAQNTKEVMFASYAQLLPADGLVHYSGTAGHVRMVSEVNVVYDENGNIDGEKSTLKYRDQDSSWSNYKKVDGQSVQIQGGLDVKVSFQKLYSSSYLPFTFAELLGIDEVEKGEVACTLETGTAVTSEILKAASVSSNYAISDVFVIFENKESGEEADRLIKRATSASKMEMSLEDTIKDAIVSKYTDGNYKVKIMLQISTGELLCAFEGDLTAE